MAARACSERRSRVVGSADAGDDPEEDGEDPRHQRRDAVATETDSALPQGAIDLVLMVDVYHELPRPDLTLAQVKAALRPGGRLVLVEYRAEDARVPAEPEHKMSIAQITRELEASSFAITLVDESLPHQRIVVSQPRSRGHAVTRSRRARTRVRARVPSGTRSALEESKARRAAAREGVRPFGE